MKQIETENDVKALVKEWYDVRGAWSYAPIQTGLGEHGIHDRIGCVPVTITPEMVGQRIGVFVSVEAKAPGRRKEPRRGMSAHQARHLKRMTAAGRCFRKDIKFVKVGPGYAFEGRKRK